MCAGKIMYSTTNCRENESEKQEKRKRKMNQEDEDTLNDEERIINNIKDKDRSTNNNDSTSSKTDWASTAAMKYFPVGIWRRNNVVSTSMRRYDVTSTLIQRCLKLCAYWVKLSFWKNK